MSPYPCWFDSVNNPILSLSAFCSFSILTDLLQAVQYHFLFESLEQLHLSFDITFKLLILALTYTMLSILTSYFLPFS